MAVSSITQPKSANAYDPTQTQQSQLPQQTLSQADFLKLLVAQLSTQDPLNPVSNTDFAAQMAQFSTLQATQTMQTDLSSVQTSLALLEARSLLGKTVDLKDSTGQTVSGTVTGVRYESGAPNVIVNGQSYPLSQVISLSQAQVPTQTN